MAIEREGTELLKEAQKEGWSGKKTNDLFEKEIIPFFVMIIRKECLDQSFADDVLSHCYSKVWEKRDTIRAGKSFKSWLSSICYNKIREEQRKTKRFAKWVSLDGEKLISDVEDTD